MPVSVDPDAPKSPNIWTSQERETLALLYAQNHLGFRPWDIADQTPISRDDAHNAVYRLHNRDMIGITETGHYFALNDEQVREYVRENCDLSQYR